MKGHKLLISILLMISFFLISSSFISFSYAQEGIEPFNVPSFEFHKTVEILGSKENMSSIQVNFPELNWTITNIEINFSNIILDREIKTIEDIEYLNNFIFRQNINQKRLGLSVQLEIQEFTTLYGVFIKGYRVGTVNDSIKFQIQGYDKSTERPNNTVYRSINLNMSTGVDWYYQDFSSDPIDLNIGNYSLVMKADETLSLTSLYYWSNNQGINQSAPYLHTSSYVNSWSPGELNSTFLHKLNQRTNETYYPLDINMTAEINGDKYNILNGPVLGSGILQIPNLSYLLSNLNLNIPIENNNSFRLLFNYSYNFVLKNSFSSSTTVNIEENRYNLWSTFPIINIGAINYSVDFHFPHNWFNFTVYRKLGISWENVTSFIDFNLVNNILRIPNTIILDGAEWKIIANSPNIVFGLDLPVLDWEPGQNLQFTVNAPINDGNLSFYLINSLGFGYEEPVEIREITSEENLFSYLIPSNSRAGTYTIIICWNNNTDGGTQSLEFEISIPPIPFTIDPIWIVIGIIIAIGGSVAGIISYRTIKKYRTRKLEEKEILYNKCMDVLNLDYVILSDKKSGINVYQQKFSDKDIDAAMISGFLQAIHSFGIELIKIEDTSQTIKLEYKDSIIIMTEFVNLRLILIMKESPSTNFLYSLEDLAFDLYKYYGKLIDDFNGDIKPFKSIDKLLRHHLNTTLTYPLNLKKREKLETIRITPSQRELINNAVSFMKMNKTDTFNLASVLRERECSPKDLENIFKLIEKDIFQVIE
ncbi:MAG: hypothetical protein JSV62_00160 [Promethearchaeota archaeon]|nr:MAG: hypothetical protein JSV62_00160 [Candidatus Lokiarchaeota archaeon]